MSVLSAPNRQLRLQVEKQICVFFTILFIFDDVIYANIDSSVSNLYVCLMLKASKNQSSPLMFAFLIDIYIYIYIYIGTLYVLAILIALSEDFCFNHD
jgi:hypothetical protein